MLRLIPYKIPDILFLPPDPLGAQAFQIMTDFMKQGSHTDLVVEHIGSTAIPGMPGKNSINILIPTEQENFSVVLKHLERLGFTEHPFKREPEDRPLRVTGAEIGGRKYWFHVHIVERNSPNHRGPLFFRDYLIGNPEAAARYALLKEGLLGKKLSSEEYNAAKQPFIRDILSRQL